MELSELRKFIQKTNPQMTNEKLMKELRKSSYATVSVLVTMGNVKEREVYGS